MHHAAGGCRQHASTDAVQAAAAKGSAAGSSRLPAGSMGYCAGRGHTGCSSRLPASSVCYWAGRGGAGCSRLISLMITAFSSLNCSSSAKQAGVRDSVV